MDEDGYCWTFDKLVDHDGDELTGEVEQADICVIVVKHPSGEVWSTLVLADFEDVKPFN